MSTDTMYTDTQTGGDSQEIPTISIKSLIEDLRSGVTRCKGDKGYDPERGSIQEKYGLTKADTKEIFKHEKLAGLKVRIPKQLNYHLVDDTSSSEEASSLNAEYGAPTASAVERMSENADHAEETTEESVPQQEPEVAQATVETDF